MSGRAGRTGRLIELKDIRRTLAHLRGDTISRGMIELQVVYSLSIIRVNEEIKTLIAAIE